MNIDNQANITFRKNNYMTTHNKSCILKKEKNIIESLESKSIFNKFYFKRNVDFSLPKVYISLNLFHPYLRPMNKLNSDKKCYYFKIIEMFSLIKRKINEKLADAIRAGNEISLGQNENFFYINVFCFEDVAYKIMEQIKNIIIDTNWESTDFISNNKVYKNEVFDDIFNYDKDDIDYISKYYFYCKIKNSLYNLYEFFPEEFEKK